MSRTFPALDDSALDRALTYPLGGFRRVAVLAETGSTNADLAAHAANDPARWPDLSVLIADSQISGKGRLDRSWEVPARTAMISSVLLRPTDSSAHPGVPTFLPTGYGWLSILAGIALCQAVNAEAGVPAMLKWPNDVVVNGRKLAGILGQMVVPHVEAQRVSGVPGLPGLPSSPSIRTDHGARLGPAVVVGVGANISQEREQLPVERATSLALVGAGVVDRNVLLPAYLNRFARLYQEFVAVGGDALRPLSGGESVQRIAATLMTTLGTAVRAELPGGKMLFGTAVRLGSEGGLEIKTDDGALHTVSAGDVVHLRRIGETGVSYA